MSLITTIGTLLSVALAALVSWQLGGSLGAGAMAGFLLGSALSLLGVFWQKHILRTQPKQLMLAMVVPFLFKLVALLIGALSLRYIEAVGARADWRSFLVGFASAAVIVLALGTLRAMLERSSKRSGAKEANPMHSEQVVLPDQARV